MIHANQIETMMPRPLLILLILAAAIVAVLVGLAALDREVPTTHVERPLANEAAH